MYSFSSLLSVCLSCHDSWWNASHVRRQIACNYAKIARMNRCHTNSLGHKISFCSSPNRYNGDTVAQPLSRGYRLPSIQSVHTGYHIQYCQWTRWHWTKIIHEKYFRADNMAGVLVRWEAAKGMEIEWGSEREHPYQRLIWFDVCVCVSQPVHVRQSYIR